MERSNPLAILSLFYRGDCGPSLALRTYVIASEAGASSCNDINQSPDHKLLGSSLKPEGPPVGSAPGDSRDVPFCSTDACGKQRNRLERRVNQYAIYRHREYRIDDDVGNDNAVGCGLLFS